MLWMVQIFINLKYQEKQFNIKVYLLECLMQKKRKKSNMKKEERKKKEEKEN